MTLVVAAFLAGISWNVSLLYLAGAVILIIGLSTTIKSEVSHQRGIDKIITFGLCSWRLRWPSSARSTLHSPILWPR